MAASQIPAKGITRTPRPVRYKAGRKDKTMHFTIALLEDVHGEIKVNFDSTGNKYLVGVYNKLTREYTHKTFDNMNTACAIFTKLCEWVVKGEYSYEDRKELLA